MYFFTSFAVPGGVQKPFVGHDRVVGSSLACAREIPLNNGHHVMRLFNQQTAFLISLAIMTTPIVPLMEIHMSRQIHLFNALKKAILKVATHQVVICKC